MIRLERVIDALPDDFESLRTEARAEGHRMLDTLGAEWEASRQRFDRDGEALIAAYSDDTLAGIGGLTVEPAISGAFRMRRFYVCACFRRTGIARRMAVALIDCTPGTTRIITANAAAGSERFWESLGFVPDRRDGRTHILRQVPPCG